ncbi:hypothetical protein LSH36_417g04010 [Paralvinella palmiformis]|uniref:Uncharacterized protein n=1 Tax=Paralvinella palmiformis TaxID=53620 RepID=A0AAD9JBQ9_9ANNE|nr:hypothetical protein LSH36_417g04010 [Paralvinella palmiformis]
MKTAYLICFVTVLMLLGLWITNTTRRTRRNNEMSVELGETVPSKSAIDWNERFWFVPNDVRNCFQLFSGNYNLSASFVEEYNKFIIAYQEIMKEKTPREGYTGLITVAFKAYLELASHSSVKTICETGFNAGHSTFGWLTINPNAHVYTFDIGVHRYAKPMAKYIRSLHPERFTITWGDSRKTLPAFHRQHPEVSCDLIVIDGGHTTDICKADFFNFKQMASADSVVILDNYPQKSWKFNKILGDVWEWAKRNGEVSEIFRCHVDRKPSDFGLSVGKYINSFC